MRSLWTSTTGMSAQNLNMDVIANNLANVSTTGFKKSRADFQDLLYQILKVPGSPTSADTRSPTGIQVGLGVKPAAVTKVFTEGDIVQTENPLDVAIEGSGFFQVELPDGNTAYTLTQKGEPFDGAQVTRQAVAQLIVDIVKDKSGRYSHTSLGVGEPNTNWDKPSFY